MSQPTSIDLSHQVPRSGGTYDATSPQYGSNTVYLTSAHTLKVFEQNVHCPSGTFTITLPPVCEAVGRMYIISSLAATVTVQDAGDDPSMADVSTIAAKEVGVFVSNGVCWASIDGDATT